MTHITYVGQTDILLVSNSSVITRVFPSGDELRLEVPRLPTVPWLVSSDTTAVPANDDHGDDTALASADDAEEAAVDADTHAVKADVTKSVDFSILGVCSSTSGQQVAALTSDKLACVWSGAAIKSCQLLGAWQLPKKPCCAVFTPHETSLLVADKNGDVYLCDLVKKDRARLLFGHLSMILDITMLPCGRYVVTCDRDEKVRVTCYPNTHSIHTYCLGHREFVNCVHSLSSNLIVTAGGDGVVHLWNALTGRSVCSASLSAFEHTVSSPVDQKMAVINLLILTLHGDQPRAVIAVTQRRVFVFALCMNGEDSCQLSASSSLETADIAASCSSADKLLLLLASSSDRQVAFYRLIEQPDCISLQMETEHRSSHITTLSKLAPFSHNFADVQSLYKHSYDNVSSYLQRKKERNTSESNIPSSKRTRQSSQPLHSTK